METIEIYFDNIKGTATRLTNTNWDTTWKVVINDRYFVMKENYDKKETYELLECSEGMDNEKAIKQMSNIAWQLYQHMLKNRPRPPKRVGLVTIV